GAVLSTSTAPYPLPDAELRPTSTPERFAHSQGDTRAARVLRALRRRRAPDLGADRQRLRALRARDRARHDLRHGFAEALGAGEGRGRAGVAARQAQVSGRAARARPPRATEEALRRQADAEADQVGAAGA